MSSNAIHKFKVRKLSVRDSRLIVAVGRRCQDDVDIFLETIGRYFAQARQSNFRALTQFAVRKMSGGFQPNFLGPHQLDVTLEHLGENV
jgi:hypothetical protein